MVASLPSVAWAQSPQPGEVQVVPAITLSLQVGGTGKETKRATYTPPPGWYIRSHSVTCTQRYGHSSYSISTVPAGWTSKSEEGIDEAFRQLIEAAVQPHDLPLRARLNLRRNEAIHELRSTNISQHALVLDATARGEGLFWGGGIDLQVMAELVYVGNGGNGHSSKMLLRPDVGGQNSEVREQRSDVRDRKSEVNGQKSEVRNKK
jgi:hypothetical protein